MRSRVRQWERCVGLAFALGAAIAPSVAQSRGLASQVLALDEVPASGADTSATDEVIKKMLARNRLRDAGLHRYTAVRTYELKNPAGIVAARTVVHVSYEAPDKRTFAKISEQGSVIVRYLVFDRLLQSEAEASSGREHRDSAITTANYFFVPSGEEDIGQYHCFVLQVAPKRKDKYLFEGKIWVDAQDFAIVKITGHPAKKVSFWVDRAEFVRQYEKIDGFWVPRRDETSVDVKMYGHKIFTVDHQQYAINPAAPAQSESGNPTIHHN